MSDPVEFLLTFLVAVGLPFIAGAALAYFGYTQKPKSRGLLITAGGAVALAFLAGVGTILFFTMVPEEVRDRAHPQPANPVADYHAEINQRAGRIGTALGRLSPLLLSPQLGNAEWQEQVTTQAAVIQLEYEVMGRMNVPADERQPHRALLDALGECNRAMDRLIAGVERVDNQALTEAGELLMSCDRGLADLN